MMNFNGQLKKRTVNLGGRPKKSREQLLLSAQKEREKREKERQMEQKVVLIQRKVRRFLKLLHYRLIEGSNWSNSISQNDLNSSVFQFNVFYTFIFKHNDQRLDQIKALNQLVTSKTISELRPNNIKGIYKTAFLTLQILRTDQQIDVQVLVELLNILSILPLGVIANTSISVLPALIQIFNDVYGTAESGLQQKLLAIINSYSFTSVSSYIAFLSSPHIPALEDFHINYTTLSSELPLHDLNIDQKILLLHNIIVKSSVLTTESVTTVAYITSSIDVSLTSKEEQELINDNSETEESSLTMKIVPKEVLDVIKTLYDRKYISFTSQNIKDWNLLSLTYGSLMDLVPSVKSSFIIFLIPSMFENSLNSIINSKIFNYWVSMNEDIIFKLPSSTLSNLFVDESSFVFHDLRLFLELINYRLIISNDFELFTTYGFTLEKLKLIAIFLKRFVFNLIWNGQKIKSILTAGRYSFLKHLTTTVLTQIYLKDSRQNVLPKDLWLININKVSNLVDSIIDYENKKEHEIHSDDEEQSFMRTLTSEAQAKIEIYLQTPFFIPFETRVKIFQSLVETDRRNNSFDEDSSFFAQFIGRKQSATIRREHILEDAYDSFNSIGRNFKSQLQIVFVNENGREEGIDGGGLTKEFLTSVVRDGFKGLFVTNSENGLYPNPQIGLAYQYRIDTEEQLKSLEYIKFLGKVIGKCLYERTLVDITFANFFLTKFNSRYRNSFDDLRSLDGELYSNLIKLLGYSDEQLKELNIPFSVDEKVGQKHVSIDLIPNGNVTYVNGTNKLKFIHELSNFKLNRMINLPCNFFLSGLYEMISRDWLSMFNPYELQMLISGEQDINVEDLKKHTAYGGCDEYDETIKNFWSVVEEMSTKDRFQLVKFVTSVPRAPLLGFGALNPNFGITIDADSDRLPTSSTCVNLLRLPHYKDKETLRKKLLYAINAEAGFDLA